MPQLVAACEQVYAQAGTVLELDYALFTDGIIVGVVVRRVGSRIQEWRNGVRLGLESSRLQVQIQRELARVYGGSLTFVVSQIMHAYARVIREAKSRLGDHVATKLELTPLT